MITSTVHRERSGKLLHVLEFDAETALTQLAELVAGHLCSFEVVSETEIVVYASSAYGRRPRKCNVHTFSGETAAEMRQVQIFVNCAIVASSGNAHGLIASMASARYLQKVLGETPLLSAAMNLGEEIDRILMRERGVVDELREPSLIARNSLAIAQGHVPEPRPLYSAKDLGTSRVQSLRQPAKAG